MRISVVAAALEFSVIVCTYNPRAQYLSRVLDALRMQTMPKSDWELIVVDNKSTAAVEERFDVSWHPNGRHVLERGARPDRCKIERNC